MQWDFKRMFLGTLQSFLVVIVIALIVGILGLLYGYFQTREFTLSEYQNWFIPKGLTQLRRFLCVGYMHNSSYLNAVVALAVTSLFQIYKKRQSSHQTPRITSK